MTTPPPHSPPGSAKQSSPRRVNIISAVKTQLGFFSLVLLITEGILGALATRATGLDFTLLVVGMLSVLIGVVVAVAVLGAKAGSETRVDRDSRVKAVVSSEKRSIAVGMVDNQLENQIRQLRTNVQLAAERNNPILTEEIAYEINELLIDSADWSRGELHTSVQRYNRVLLTLYSHAKESIFSTTVRDYLADWPDELMEKMILASEDSRARSVTRVFVFNRREEIDQRAIDVLNRFKRCSKIRSLVFIDSEDFFDFPADISRDFVVIDEGDEIGVTLSYGPGNLRAVWYFGDKDRKTSFQRTCRGLLNGSKSVDEILDWWQKQIGTEEHD